MRDKELKSLVRAARKFFQAFERVNFNDLSLPHIQNQLDANALDVDNILDGGFTRKISELK